MHFACWVSKDARAHQRARELTHTHAHAYTYLHTRTHARTHTVIRQRASVLRYTYIVCLVKIYYAHAVGLLGIR
jgi:hypothetical protein